jgi:hypothetical protein
MLFSVIYSADCPSDMDILDYAPPELAELWDETESDESFDYGYLEGRWEGGHHRKWCAVLNREQFDKFVSALGLYAESTETMGSLGAPGFGMGWSPALSFTSEDQDAILSAYVTPVPETAKEHGDDQDWRRVRKAILAVYG